MDLFVILYTVCSFFCLGILIIISPFLFPAIKNKLQKSLELVWWWSKLVVAHVDVIGLGFLQRIGK